MNKKIFFFVVLVLIAAAVFIAVRSSQKAGNTEVAREISPHVGSIQKIFSSTGTVLPKNRLEIKPPVNGRIDNILVKEGQEVTEGQTLAWMSSSERAAILDAARGQGEEALEYWQQVYKPIPLLAPIAGQVIVATTQPGQTVTTADPVIVLSDQLIVRAQVDETDIGRVKLGQEAVISLDAYPQEKINAEVGHIYYESKTVNNVTMYEADLIPERIPPFFRSGMNASIDFVENSSENALLIPLEAVHKEEDKNFVFVKRDGSVVKQDVAIGIADDKNVEITSGVSQDDRIIIKSTKYELPKTSTGTNPFMPARRQRTGR